MQKDEIKEHDWVKRKQKAWPGHIYKCSKCGMYLSDFHGGYYRECKNPRDAKYKRDAADDAIKFVREKHKPSSMRNFLLHVLERCKELW